VTTNAAALDMQRRTSLVYDAFTGAINVGNVAEEIRLEWVPTARWVSLGLSAQEQARGWALPRRGFLDDEQLVMPLCAERIAGHTFERDVGLMEAASGSGPVPGTLMSYIAAVHSLAWATAYNLELIDAGNDMAGVNRFWAGHYLRSQWSTALVLETELAGDV